MAHNTSSLPWESLTSKWEPKFVRLKNTKYTDEPSEIEIKFEDQRRRHWDSYFGDSQILRDFAQSFSKRAVAEAQRLKQQLPQSCEPAQLGDLIISDAVATRITPHVLRYRISEDEDSPYALPISFSSSGASIPLCAHHTGLDCGCILPLPYRRRAAFCFPVGSDGPCQVGSEILPIDTWFSRVIFSILLIQNETQPIFRALESPGEAPEVESGQDPRPRFPKCCSTYKSVLADAMCPYIMMNALYQLREIWHPTAKRAPWHDYRDTDLYQALLSEVSSGLKPRFETNIPQWPHEDFF